MFYQGAKDEEEVDESGWMSQEVTRMEGEGGKQKLCTVSHC